MTFDVNKWLEEGRAHKDQLPEGVVLPAPEIDYEAYREALQAFYDGTPEYGNVAPNETFSWDDEIFTRGLIAAWERMPETKALKATNSLASGGWIAHVGDTCPPGLEDKMVEVILSRDDGTPATLPRVRFGRQWDWGTTLSPHARITHYRVAKED